MKPFDPAKTVYLIDGSSFLYRAYYGVRPLHTTQGIPIQAVYSFCRMIKKIMDRFNPQYMALVWDSKGTTIRHEMYPAYKATRQEPPSDLFQQKQYIKKFADLIGLQQVEQPGVEADDLMYSVALEQQKKGMNSILITSDKDMGQIISDHLMIFDPFKDIIIDKPAFEQTMGFTVDKLPFYFGILGDTSDNIPGVKGIGKVGATELVKQFASMEDMYQNINKIKKERTRNLLEEQKQEAFLSEKLFRFHYYPVGLKTEDFIVKPENWVHARPLFEELEFKTLLKELQEKEPTTEKLSETKGYVFKTIVSEAALEELIQTIKKKKYFAIDTELTGLKALQDDLVGISICVEKGTSYYIPFGHKVVNPQLSQETVFNALKPIFSDESIKKIMHHAKFDMLALWHYGIEVRGLIFDTLVAAHLVTEDWQRVKLKYLSHYYLNEPMLSYEEIVTRNGFKNFSFVPLENATEYAAADAHQTLQLVDVLKEQLKKQEMDVLFDTIEFPLINVLFKMQAEGIYVDTQVLDAINQKVTKELELLSAEIISLIGDEFKDINLNSPKQLGELLFTHLKLPPQKKTTGRTGFSTDQEVLEELALLHPVPGLIIKYRELFKLKSTYIDALPTYINPNTGKIHTSFSQTAVATGRLASSDPNLQNIPTETVYLPGVHIRSAFKPEENHIFLSADYSQIELRVLAFLSQDDALLDAFNTGVDIHQQTASKLFDTPLEQVTHQQRQIGKRINFSILYGLTPYGLSKDLKIPFKDAKLYIEKYFAQYPKVSAWMEQVIEQTKDHGFVTTYWGRRRYIPGIYEKNKSLYDLARRITINTRAQGTAAELMKLGMINLDKALKEHNLNAKMLLQIHDELLLSVPLNEQDRVEKLVKDVLENVVTWNVPLIVSTRFGKTWQDVTK